MCQSKDKKDKPDHMECTNTPPFTSTDTGQHFKTPKTKNMKIVPSGKENMTPYSKSNRCRRPDSLQPYGVTRQNQNGGKPYCSSRQLAGQQAKDCHGAPGVPGRQQDPAAWRRSNYGKEVMGNKNSRLKRLDWGKLTNVDQENIPSNKERNTK